jgi:hypothetical protein
MKTLLILPLTMLFLFFHSTSQSQTCSLTCPDNIVAKADSGQGGTYVKFPTANFSTDCGVVTYTPASGSFFKIGSSSVIVTSAKGDRCSFTVTVTDNEPPMLSPIVLSSKKLWPANGKMKEVAVRYIATDNANETSCAVTVTNNDSTTQNWEVVDNHLVRLKQTRLSNGMARVYMITVTCTDAAGNTTKRSTGIAVAKNVSSKKQ